MTDFPYNLLWDECDVTIAIDVAPTRHPEEMELPSALDAVLGMFDMMVDNVVAGMLKQRPPPSTSAPS